MYNEFERIIFIEHPGTIKVRNRQLLITDTLEGTKESVPIDDISVILMESPDLMVSHMALDCIAESGAVLIGCDLAGMPSYELLPMTASSTPGRAWKAQRKATEEMEAALWSQIVLQKIQNQAAAMRSLGMDASVIEKFATEDAARFEGVAASLYFKRLFGPDFIRDRQGAFPNSLLNFGYAVLASKLAKVLLVSGFHLGFGVHHSGERNRIPLVYDVIEPFRPLVDVTVRRLLDEGHTVLDRETKTELAEVLQMRMTYPNGVTADAVTAMRNLSSSLLKTLNDGAGTLRLPCLPE